MVILMVRTQIQLTEKQVQALKWMAQREGVSMAEVIRRAVDKAVESQIMPDREELWRRATEAIGCIHSDITDMSERHDDYFVEASD